MLADDVRSTTWPSVSAMSTLEEACRQMSEMRTRILLVSEGGTAIGAIGEFDIALAAIVEACDPSSTMVRDVMPAGPAHCPECLAAMGCFRAMVG